MRKKKRKKEKKKTKAFKEKYALKILLGMGMNVYKPCILMQVSRHGHIDRNASHDHQSAKKMMEKKKKEAESVHTNYIYKSTSHGGNCKCRDYSLPNMVTQSTSIMDMSQDLILIIITPKKKQNKPKETGKR